MDGIYLDADVTKTCFNIFYLRCKEALTHFPDEDWLRYEATKETRRGSHLHVAWEWNEILKRLELDKRYDAAWIQAYLDAQG